MALTEYKKKRKFDKTPEPGPEKNGQRPANVCDSKASRTALHYDFRLEVDGVLKSWAAPRSFIRSHSEETRYAGGRSPSRLR